MPNEIRKIRVSVSVGSDKFELARKALCADLREKVQAGWTKQCGTPKFKRLLRQQAGVQATLQVDDESGSMPTWTSDSITIRQSQTPDSAVVYQGQSESEATVGADDTSLDNICVRLQNAQGSAVSWNGQRVSKLLWNKTTIRAQDLTDFSGDLPSIDLRSVKMVGKSHLSGSIVIDGGEAIPLTFDVNIVAGMATAWKIEMHDSSIPCAVAGKLSSAFDIGVVDQHGNAAEPMAHKPAVACISQDVQLHEPGMKRVDNRFELLAAASLTGKVGEEAGRNVTLQITDESGTLEAEEIFVILKPGQATAIHVRSDNGFLEDEGTEWGPGGDGTGVRQKYRSHKATVKRDHSVPSLQALLVDTCGNKVVGERISLALTAHEHVKMKKISSKTVAQSGIATFTPHSDEDRIVACGDEYYLEVSGRGLRSMRIVCIVVLSNRVIEMTPEFSSETVKAGELIWMSLALKTEDGEKPDVQAGSFAVTLKDDGRLQAKGVVTVHDVAPHVRVDSWQKKGRHADDNGCAKHVGLYDIICKFIENRPGMEPAPMVCTTSITVVAGKATALKLLDDTTMQVVTNGSVPADRELLDAPVLQVKDTHGNDTTLDGQVSLSLHIVDGTEIEGALEGETTCTADADGKITFLGAIRLKQGNGGDVAMELHLRFTAAGILFAETGPIHFTPHSQIVSRTRAAQSQLSSLRKQLQEASKLLESLETTLQDDECELESLKEQATAKQQRILDSCALVSITAHLDSPQGIERVAAGCVCLPIHLDPCCLSSH